MRKLLFKNCVHNTEPVEIPNDKPRAVNLTVRRGLKWADLEVGDIVEIRKTGAEEPPIGAEVRAKIFDVKVMVFHDLKNYPKMLHLGHDPACRYFPGLLDVMRETYDGFLLHEIVTLVFYELLPCD